MMTQPTPCPGFIIQPIPPPAPPPVLSMPAINEEMAGVAPTTLPHSNLLSLPISWRAHLNEGYDFSHKALSEKCIYL